MDSNHRRHCQQIYSLSPLATREFPHINLGIMCALDGAGGRTRTPDLLITNQLLYQLSYTGRCSAHVRLLYYIMNPKNVKRAFLQIVHCLIPFYIVLLFLVIL